MVGKMKLMNNMGYLSMKHEIGEWKLPSGSVRCVVNRGGENKQCEASKRG